MKSKSIRQDTSKKKNYHSKQIVSSKNQQTIQENTKKPYHLIKRANR